MFLSPNYEANLAGFNLAVLDGSSPSNNHGWTMTIFFAHFSSFCLHLHFYISAGRLLVIHPNRSTNHM